MNLYEWLFIVQLLALIVISILKLYNLMNSGEWYDFKISILLFIGFFLFWAIGFVVLNLDHNSGLIYAVIFRIENFLLLLNVLFFITEIIFLVRDSLKKSIKAYKSIDYQQTNYRR